MDSIRNPYAPGAGTPPPELAGRDSLLSTVHIALARIRLGKPSKSVLMVGLRGVGKTVLLDRMRDDAETAGFHTVRTEAPEGRSLPALLAPQLPSGVTAPVSSGTGQSVGPTGPARFVRLRQSTQGALSGYRSRH